MTAGKGDLYRKVDQQKYADGYDRIFGKLKDAARKLDPLPEPKDARIHPRCGIPFCSCVDKCVQMEPIDAGDLHR